MPLVSLEQDARYRFVDGRYIEVCRACGADRAADTCRCGAPFERIKRSFWTTAWTPADVAPKLPDCCPHCEQSTSRRRSVTLHMPTRITGASVRQTRMTIEFGSCPKMLPPFLAWLCVLASVTLVVFFGLGALFLREVPLIIATGAALAALVASWRAYGWFRFAGFDHRSLRFRVRRPRYAAQLAALNQGHVR